MLIKKITKIIIGTNNKGKLREIKNLLPKNLQIYSPSVLKIKSPIENGKTFRENSLIKAKFFSLKSKMICLSDDSGLEIDVLDRRPGIYSARWGGKKGNFNKAINRVFNELDKKNINWKNKKIKARFICSLTIYWPNKKIINSVGKIEGYISPFKKGKNGFGYDPIFVPDGHELTFGEMDTDFKHSISHRAEAFNLLKSELLNDR